MESNIDINVASNEIVVEKVIIIEGKIILVYSKINRNTYSTYCGQETIEKFDKTKVVWRTLNKHWG